MPVAALLVPGLLVSVAVAFKLGAMASAAGVHRVFLYPLAILLSAYTGENFAEKQGLYHFTDFYLDYSCAGINFFTIVALTTAWLVPQSRTFPRPFALLLIQTFARAALLLTAVYAVTLAANFTRVAVFLSLQSLATERPWLHEAVGIAVFLSLLTSYTLILYRIKNAQQPSNP